MNLVNIGFGNLINADRVISIVSPESAPVKRIVQKGKENGTLIDATQTEEKIRNTAAHDIVSVTEITIKNRTGFSADKIMQMIQKLFIYTGIKIKKEYWDSYDQMNQAILQKMELIEAWAHCIL